MSGLISWPGRVGQNKSPDMLESIRDGLKRPGEAVFRTDAKAVVMTSRRRKYFKKNQELQVSVGREGARRAALHFQGG